MEPKWLTTQIDEAWKQRFDTEFFPFVEAHGMIVSLQRFYDAYPFPEVEMTDGLLPGHVWEKTIFSAVAKYMSDKLTKLNYTTDQIQDLWSDTAIF